MFMQYNYSELFKPEEVICYLRKSRTDDPALTVEEVLEKHELRLDEWAEQNLGAKVPQENKFYEIVSGEKISERPEFNKVLRLIENPKYKLILCFDTARLSRGDLEDAGRLIKLLRYTSTHIITVSPFDFYDLSLERDRELFERALKRGNEYLEYFKKVSNNGKFVSCSQGNFIASEPPYGYNKTIVIENKKHCPTLEINEEQAEVVRMIFDMYVNRNMTRGRIARYLDEMNIKPKKSKYWNPAVIEQMISNVHYIGKVRWNYKKTISVVEDGEIKKRRPRAKQGDFLVFEGKHEPIISEELFYAAQDKKGKCHRSKVSTELSNPFAGLLWCKCGRSMTCIASKSPARLVCTDQTHCKTGSINLEVMIEEISVVLEQKIEDFEIRLNCDENQNIKMHEKLIKNLEKKLSSLEEKELAQWEQQSHPDPSQRMPAEIFKKLNERLLAEKEETKQALSKAKNSMPEPVNYEEKIYRFRKALEALKNPNIDVESKNAFLKACIDKIVYTREKPERLKSQKSIYYDKTTKLTKSKSPLKKGSSWSNPPIELDIRLNE